jgi:hypothetical protein
MSQRSAQSNPYPGIAGPSAAETRRAEPGIAGPVPGSGFASSTGRLIRSDPPNDGRNRSDRRSAYACIRPFRRLSTGARTCACSTTTPGRPYRAEAARSARPAGAARLVRHLSSRPMRIVFAAYHCPGAADRRSVCRRPTSGRAAARKPENLSKVGRQSQSPPPSAPISAPVRQSAMTSRMRSAESTRPPRPAYRWRRRFRHGLRSATGRRG